MNDLISCVALLDAMPKNDELFSHDVRRVICDAPAVDAEPVRHGWWEHTKKHLWHKENGKIDMWYLDCGYHNGPGCEVCGVSVCEHCEPDWEEMECKYGHYICSVCGEPQKTHDLNYCPNCGAKMDLKEE